MLPYAQTTETAISFADDSITVLLQCILTYSNAIENLILLEPEEPKTAREHQEAENTFYGNLLTLQTQESIKLHENKPILDRKCLLDMRHSAPR